MKPVQTSFGAAARAFSLIELVVSLVILLILLPTAIPLYDRFLGDARDEALRQRLSEIRRALSTFRMENGRYPNWLYDSYGNNVDFLDSERSELVQGVHSGAGKYPSKRRIYLAEIPADPITEKKDWELIITMNEDLAALQSTGGLRTTTENSRRPGWKKVGSSWIAPAPVVNPTVQRPVPTSGVSDIRSRATGYQEM